jgi:hypothetical protein
MEVWHIQSLRTPVTSDQDDTIRRMLNNRLAKRGCQQWWQEKQDEYPVAFRNWVNERTRIGNNSVRESKTVT